MKNYQSFFQELAKEAQRLHKDPNAFPDQDRWPRWTRQDFFDFAKLVIETVSGERVKNEEEILKALHTLESKEITPTVPQKLDEMIREYEDAQKKDLEARENASKKLRVWTTQQKLVEQGARTEEKVLYNAQEESPRPLRRETAPPPPKPESKKPGAPKIPVGSHYTPTREPKPIGAEPISIITTAQATPTTPTTPTQVQPDTNIPEIITPLYITTTNNPSPFVQAVIKTVATLPVQAVRSVVLLGQEVFAKQEPQAATTINLVWRNGVTSKQFKTAISVFQQQFPTSERAVVDALVAQASSVEQYEQTHPFLTGILKTLQGNDQSVTITSQPTRPQENQNVSVQQLLINTTTKTVTQAQNILRPHSLELAVYNVLHSPVLRTILAPVRHLTAELGKSAGIFIIRAPVAVPEAIFGKAEATVSGVSAQLQLEQNLPGDFYTQEASGGVQGIPPSYIAQQAMSYTTRRGGGGLANLLSLGGRGLNALGLNIGGLLGGGATGAAGAGTTTAAGTAVAGGAAVAAGGGTALIIGVIVVAVLIIFGFLNINNYQGAYLSNTDIIIEEPNSPYVDVVKAAQPTSLQNDQIPTQVTFTVTVNATQAKLTNINVIDQANILKSSGTNPATIPQQNYPHELNQGNSFTITYPVEVQGDFKDSILSNNVIVTADVPDKNLRSEKSRANAAVIIGTPPTFCYTLTGSWTQQEQTLAREAISYIAQSPAFMKNVCGDNNEKIIQLERDNSDPGYGGEHFYKNPALSVVKIYKPAGYILNYSLYGMAYLISHESGHAVQRREGNIYQQFVEDAGIKNEGFIKSYPFEKKIDEDFAEMMGAYVEWSHRAVNGVSINYPQDYPSHYRFAKEKLFGGVEY